MITKKLTKIIRNGSYPFEAINTFQALYAMLGETELRDGIATAMQDEGYDEEYEDIMYELDNEEDIIKESGE